MSRLLKPQNTIAVMLMLATATLIGCKPAADTPDGTTEAPPAEEAAQAEETAAPLKALKAPTDAKLLAALPDKWNAPDGMCLLPNGNVLMATPNVNNGALDPPADHPTAILQITPENEVSLFMNPPLHPVTGKAYPFGINTDPEGNLYIADLQWFANPEDPGNNSRVLKVPLTDGKPSGDPIVMLEGMVVANAVIIRDGYLYVSDTTMVPGSKPLITGVFRSKLSEPGTKLTLPLIDDPHLIATIESHNPDVGFGADGLTFDNDGNLYIGNFADGTMHKVEFDAEGNPKLDPKTERTPVWAKADFMKSCDGIFFDKKTEKIYVADSLANAVQIVSLDGTVETLIADVENDGSGGRLDQPSEVLVRGNELIIANFDMPVPGGVNTKYDAPNTISVVELDE